MHKLFLADDEYWELVGIRKIIEKSELPVTVIGEAVNGVMALEALEEKVPDILITDIRMPGYSGLELAEIIRDRCLGTEVVIISGYAEFEYAQSALRSGVADYLLKPVEEEELKNVLEKIIGSRKKMLGDVYDKMEEAEELSVIKKVLHEIQDGYTQDITLISLAEQYNISACQLSKQIKEQLGMSFSKYLTSKRLQKAQELLANERLSIEAIAEQVGYKDYFYFTKVFKKNIGITPSKYRKSL